ncbi:MAG: tripartite tricarboxylate transporter substrate binding protein [Burkholderiales bacterium]|nr:tripartite tricarboxylate transporter substrate binding protein [Burkholderiales bacterium]
MQINRSLLGFTVAVLCIAAPAGAQTNFPDRPVRLMVGYPAGGTTDVLARALAQEARRSLHQEVLVINRPGATGTLAVGAVTGAPADGYTIGLSPSTTFTSAHFFQDIRPDLLETTSALVSVGRMQVGLLVKTDSPLRSVRDLVEQARRDPGKLSIGVPGVGNKTTLVLQLIAAREKIELNLVSFKGDAPVATAILGAHVTAGAFSAGSWAPQVRSGAMRVLASMEEQRFAIAPEAGTLAEQGYPYSVSALVYVYGPKALPAAVNKRLTEAFAEAARSPAYLELAVTNGLDAKQSLTGEALERFLAEDRGKIGAMVETLGVKKK